MVNTACFFVGATPSSGRAAADGHHAVGAGSLERSDAVLHILNGGVRFNVAENRVGKPGGVEQVRDLFRHAEFDQIRVRTDKRFFVPAGGELRDNVFDGAMAMVRNRIEDNTVSHNKIQLLLAGQNR